MCLHLDVLLITHVNKGDSSCSKQCGAINNRKEMDCLVTEVMGVGIVQGPFLLLVCPIADYIGMKGAERLLKDTQISL